MRRVSLAVAVAVVAFSAVGCGSANKPATRAQFADRANAICRTLTRQQIEIEGRAWSRAQTVPTDQAYAREWRETEAVSRVADARVQALSRPPAQAHIIERLVAGYFEEADYEAIVANAFAGGDAVAVETAYRASNDLAKRDAVVARSLGMTDCAKAGSKPRSGTAI
jgi:hypothetical protein